MNDISRKEAIETLTEHLHHWRRLLSEGVCTKDKGEKTIKALSFAIESIKVDRAYDLAYEKVDFIEIPEGATNGDMIKTMFPNLVIHEYVREDVTEIILCNPELIVCTVWKDWWNSPYRKESEDKE